MYLYLFRQLQMHFYNHQMSWDHTISNYVSIEDELIIHLDFTAEKDRNSCIVSSMIEISKIELHAINLCSL